MADDICCPIAAPRCVEQSTCGGVRRAGRRAWSSPCTSRLVRSRSARGRLPLARHVRAGQAKIKPEVLRQKKPEQDAMLRIRNFNEVSYGFDRELAVVEASRCLECKKPACVDGCPVEVDIPGSSGSSPGSSSQAARLIKQSNALPAVCGRVCPQDDQCEKVCLLGKKGEPVAIGALERFAADFERETDQVTAAQGAAHRQAHRGRRQRPRRAHAGRRPGRQGHCVTIFESLHKAGGVLVYGIPEFRLPKAIVEAETDYLRRLGVKIEINTIVGRLYTIEELFEAGYDAVFVGTGAGLPVFMRLPGENLCNIVSANEYLTRVNLMKAYLFPDYDTPAPQGTRVAVVGGGNVAMDCARTALRMGAARSTIVYRRTRDEMPARNEEIEHAEQEGVQFRFLASPVRYIGDEQHWVRQMECVRMKMGEPDESGGGGRSRCRLELPDGRGHGRSSPWAPAPTGCCSRAPPGWSATSAATSARSRDRAAPACRACGPAATSSPAPATVILAMGAARKAADDMHAYLRDGEGPGCEAGRGLRSPRGPGERAGVSPVLRRGEPVGELLPVRVHALLDLVVVHRLELLGELRRSAAVR